MPPLTTAGEIKTIIKVYTSPDNATLAGQIGSILSKIIGFLTIIGGLGFLFYFIIGAVSWLVSTGDARKIETARAQIMNALIGLVITVAAYPIVYIIGQLLGIPIDRPTQFIEALTII